jgi:hypothetical protein
MRSAAMFVEHHHDAVTVAPTSSMTPSVLPTDVQRLVTASLSEASKRAYCLDIAHFEGTGRRLPATPEIVASYLAEGAETYAVATLQRR